MNKIAQKIILNYYQNSNKKLDAVSRAVMRENGGQKNIPRKSDFLLAYHNLIKAGKIKKNENLEKLLTKRAVRTLSGVAIITVLTKPWKCPGNCIYCPDEAKMPKSYLSSEPAAARALRLKFDPYEQVKRRIETLQENGHPTDKIELIVKGGSWNAYPLDYQYWFILRCFEAANYDRCHSERSEESPTTRQMNEDSSSARASLGMTAKQLLEEQKKNEKARHRIIGLTLETRPDMITETNLQTMRALGCTRLELGAQSTDDKILKLIKRGHNTQATKTATLLAKNFGFKVDYHLMPQLPGTTPAKDLKMMLEIFENPDYRPDMIKIYPCTVIEGTELYQWFKKGEYKNYSDKQLIETLIKFKTKIPRYCRVSRLIRDIPSTHIKAGNMATNLRQMIQVEMNKRGLKCECLRCREAGHLPDLRLKTKDLRLFVDKYTASGGMEYFLSFEDKKRQVVFAFCRLRIAPKSYKLKAISYPVYIRELHTYGQLTSFSKKGEVQHTGLGKKLVAEAEKICKKNKTAKLAVISGVGVRGYYRKLGYKLERGYMVKNL